MLKLSDIARCVEQAVDYKPNGPLGEFYGEYYSPYYAFFILAMAMPGKNKIAVELGVDRGRGLVSLAYGAGKDGKVYGVDNKVAPSLTIAVNMFNNTTFIHAAADPVPEGMPEKDIFLLHVDTEHSYSAAKTDFEAYESRLADRAIVVFDDLHAAEDSVLCYFNELPYPKIQDDRMHPVCGWGVILYERESNE